MMSCSVSNLSVALGHTKRKQTLGGLQPAAWSSRPHPSLLATRTPPPLGNRFSWLQRQKHRGPLRKSQKSTPPRFLRQLCLLGLPFLRTSATGLVQDHSIPRQRWVANHCNSSAKATSSVCIFNAELEQKASTNQQHSEVTNVPKSFILFCLAPYSDLPQGVSHALSWFPYPGCS